MSQPGKFLRPLCLWLTLLLPALVNTGCGTIAAHALVHSPNRYPTWFAPAPPVTLAYSPKFLTNFPPQTVTVGPPAARLRYRVINPADYGLKISSTNWFAHDRHEFAFSFHATMPGPTNAWTATPRGTVILLHGYGLAQFAMAPWALRLAQDGWRCVLVDLRGHGKSTGKTIYYGIQETNDLSQLLDDLALHHQLSGPVAVVGESYGAALALRWQPMDPRVSSIVAIAPYASLSNAVLNIRTDYAPWFPRWWLKAGIKKLPGLLQVPPGELDTATVLKRHPVTALFIAGTEDHIAPVADVQQNVSVAAPNSRLIIVPSATHESLTYTFDTLTIPILDWLDRTKK